MQIPVPLETAGRDPSSGRHLHYTRAGKGPCYFGPVSAGESLMRQSFGALPLAARAALKTLGYTVIPGPVAVEELGAVADAYDTAVSAAAGDDMRVGSTSTRVVDFVNRGPLFDSLYIYPPLLDAAALTVGQAFKLSSLHARTLRPGSTALDIHVDVERGSTDGPLLGFIFMVDDFTSANGATHFIPGSHLWSNSPARPHGEEYVAQLVPACGPAGSLLMFNGSTWHGQGINSSDRPRRSLQGAFIPRSGRAMTDFSGRMGPETRARLGDTARQVLAIPEVRPPSAGNRCRHSVIKS